MLNSTVYVRTVPGCLFYLIYLAAKLLRVVSMTKATKVMQKNGNICNPCNCLSAALRAILRYRKQTIDSTTVRKVNTYSYRCYYYCCCCWCYNCWLPACLPALVWHCLFGTYVECPSEKTSRILIEVATILLDAPVPSLSTYWLLCSLDFFCFCS